jgi:hypothetical protein
MFVTKVVSRRLWMSGFLLRSQFEFGIEQSRLDVKECFLYIGLDRSNKRFIGVAYLSDSVFNEHQSFVFNIFIRICSPLWTLVQYFHVIVKKLCWVLETGNQNIVSSSCQVVSTPASYSEGPRFKSLPGVLLPWLRFSCFFFQILQKNTGIVDHDRFLPYPFKFINHPVIRRFIVWDTESVVK